jgi:hypothetical protein
MASATTEAVRETTGPERSGKSGRSLRDPVEPQKPLDSTDDEILGLTTSTVKRVNDDELADSAPDDAEGLDGDKNAAKPDDVDEDAEEKAKAADAEALNAILAGNAELKSAWDDAKAYREVFESPEKAREAVALLGDLDRMDAMFFSRRTSDHARLAESIADLDADAFASLAKSMANEAERREKNGNATGSNSVANTGQTPELKNMSVRNSEDGTLKSAQEAFLQTTNAATVQAVVDAIETQVERLLPEGASKTTRNRVTGEIYRELDAALRDNKQLAQQLREAFRSGSLDASHQRAIVTLITGRARQALPSVAKKVMDEWTSTALAANRSRRDRQRTAEQRVDIAGSGGAGHDGRHGRTPRDIDYSRLSDSDILNL